MQQQYYKNFNGISHNGEEDVYVLPDDDSENSPNHSEQAQKDHKNTSNKFKMRDISETNEDEVIDEKLFV